MTFKFFIKIFKKSNSNIINHILFFFNVTSGGKYGLCQANAYCVLHKKSLSYTCECKPKYKKLLNDAGDQEICVHVCEDYCLNGGKCDVNLETNKPSCICPVNFYGEKCEKKSEFGMYLINNYL